MVIFKVCRHLQIHNSNRILPSGKGGVENKQDLDMIRFAVSPRLIKMLSANLTVAQYNDLSLSPLFIHFPFYLKLRQTSNQAVSAPQEQKVSFRCF